MELSLKSVASFASADDTVYPFTLQAVGNVLNHRLKNSIEIVRLKKDYYNRESKVQLTKIRTEKPTSVIQLPLNEKEIFHDADWNEKNLLMLSPYLLPSCTLKNTHYVKSRLSEDDLDNMMLAALTTAGVIELYKYNMKDHKLHKHPADLTELTIALFPPIKKQIKKYDELTKTYNKVAFANIDWCPVNFDNFKLLLTVTKADEILIFSIHENKAILQLKIDFDNASTNEIKWTYNEAYGHNLFVGMNNGNLMRIPLKVLKDGSVNSTSETEEIFGKIKIPPSNIHVSYNKDNEIIIALCKSHSLEVIHKSGLKINVINKQIGLSITGFDVLGNLEYIMTTLNGKVVFVRLELNENRELEIRHQNVEVSVPSDEGEPMQQSSKMGYYGVTTSKNKVFVYISAYPRQVSYL